MKSQSRATNLVRLRITKPQMCRDRGSERPLCDLCGLRPATDMHEIVPASMTTTEESRRLSFQKEICSLLCQDCHSRAGSRENVEKLLNFNVELYGRDAVISALNGLNSVISLPDYFYHLIPD